MTAAATNPIGARTLAELLAEAQGWSLRARLDLARQVAEALHARHREGLLHRGLDAANVTIDEALRARVGPPAAVRALELEAADIERCPPEFIAETAIELPADIPTAANLLRDRGVDVDPRRVDIYQFGVLLCRLLTGESLVSYRYRTRAKAKVPPLARALLDRCLGEGGSPPLVDCGPLLEALEELLRRCGDGPVATRTTPDQGNAKADATDALPFQQLGHFQILQRIGSGGMGDVYKGYDASLDRYVAIKVLPAALARDADFVRRFQAEAAAVAKIAHPNVVPIHFIGQDAGRHFFAMRFIEGESLSQRLARQPRLSLAQAITTVEQCLAGLEAAHAQGLVHRDVKPGNILLDHAGQAILVDFGLVRQIGAAATTSTGVVMGTVDYIAPEQARGHQFDGRIDIYALGVAFYQMLAGRLPFQADSAASMVFKHAFEDPLPLEHSAPDVPRPVAEIIARMMAKDPAQRYGSCAAVLADLKAVREGRPLLTKAESPDELAAGRPTMLCPPQPSPTQPASQAHCPTPRTQLREYARSPISRSMWLSLAAVAGTVAAVSFTFMSTRDKKLADSDASSSHPIPDALAAQAVVGGNSGPKRTIRPVEQPSPAVAPFAAAKAKEYQKAWAEYLGLPVESTNSLGMKLVLIPPGEFTMGSSKEFVENERRSADKWYLEYLRGESPPHRVRITRPFWLGATTVTQGQYQAVMGKNPSKFAGDANRPVEMVSNDDAKIFARLLSALPEERSAGREYRLPTEAEWEYACRAGSTGRWSFGDLTVLDSRADEGKLLGEYAWCSANADGRTHAVGQKRVNPWGLYDMYGNVFQWCLDSADPDYYSISPTEDPAGPQENALCSARGGSWYVQVVYCRSAARICHLRQGTRHDLGFRVCAVRVQSAPPHPGDAHQP
jgi:serine/threonine protein kinase/formylglycine-generating enzyme required for sulfatase activity